MDMISSSTPSSADSQRENTGLFFCRRLRSHNRMDPDLENVIRQALGDAQAAGRDHLSQNELAVRAVQRARPDMTASDALAAINRSARVMISGQT